MDNFKEIREKLPEPELTSISSTHVIENVMVEGDAPYVVFIHGGLGSMWNPYCQLDALRGDRGLLTYIFQGMDDRPIDEGRISRIM